MGYLDYTDDFIFFPRQENSQEYFNICDFKSLPKRTDTICHCFNHDRQLFYKDIFYFDPVETLLVLWGLSTFLPYWPSQLC